MCYIENIVSQIKWGAYQKAAKAVGLKNTELFSPDELEEDIKEKDPELFEKLSAFVDAVKNCWEGSNSRAKECTGTPRAELDAEMSNLLEIKRNARSAFIDEVDKKQGQ